MDKFKPIYSMIQGLTRLEVRHLIIMMLQHWRMLGLTKADLVKLSKRLQVLIDYKQPITDRESFMFAVGAVQDAAINPTERRKMVQVYNDTVAKISKQQKLQGGK
jgi:hypothetical protein